MGEAIGAVLAYAVGVGISPVPIIAVILMLFSERATVNGPLFAVGWVVGLAALVTVVYLIAGALDVGSDGDADDAVSWVRIALGVVLLVAAGRKWRQRTRAGEEPSMPGWMSRVDRFPPAAALGTGLLLSVNPKNLVLAAGAGTAVAQLGPGAAEAAVALAVFTLVGSALVVVAVVYDLAGGEGARTTLDEAKAWLTLHNSAVMAVLFLVFGAVLVAGGLGLR